MAIPDLIVDRIATPGVMSAKVRVELRLAGSLAGGVADDQRCIDGQQGR